ncbi:DUF6760 family protein [Halomonas ramblicola]|uniref:T4 family baseplate hub assembly chaperone n=1 Tax=Halomonas ramblicola TaxID=747349 RepID=UPI0025B389BF|nr:DUF6760 family protein [Halomonas ramblicola]MDN3522563.1 hypothetical protein [Halomonas ramblicola]
MSVVACRLPIGLSGPDGRCHRDALLRALGGREEELLAESEGSLSIAERITAVLASCLARIGTIEPVTEAQVRALSVADRHCLMLKLRALTFGDEVWAQVECPSPDCRAPVDVHFRLSDIPLADDDLEPEQTLTLSPQQAGTPKPMTVRFRLPNGADQERLAGLPHANGAVALTTLLAGCVLALDERVSPSVEEIRQLPASARHAIEAAMEAVAPGIELTLDTHCPDCGAAFVVPFDIQDFFFGELRSSEALLRREVHYLAFHYHWSEREIMAMPLQRRRRYIEVLAEEIERLNDAAAG